MEKISEITPEIVGRNKYNALIQKRVLTEREKVSMEPEEIEAVELTEEDQKQIEAYEASFKNVDRTQNIIDYWQKVLNPEEIVEIKLNHIKLIRVFLLNFQKFNDIAFNYTEETKLNVYTMAYYFAKDERFLKSPLLIKKVNQGKEVRTSTPSLKKGLLIIGNYGNGKSSMLKTFCKTLQTVRDHNFSFQTANNLVRDYNSLSSSEDKIHFWKRAKKVRMLIDDAKTEEEASNYGKVNLIKDIIETRADEGLITHIICNYMEGHEGNISMAIYELGKKYGPRSVDRIFGNYNIIEFKGKSFRK